MPYEIGSLNFKPINFNSIILSKELRLNRLLASTAYSWLYVYSITLFKITFPFSLISKLQFILLVEGGKERKKIETSSIPFEFKALFLERGLADIYVTFGINSFFIGKNVMYILHQKN